MLLVEFGVDDVVFVVLSGLLSVAGVRAGRSKGLCNLQQLAGALFRFLLADVVLHCLAGLRDEQLRAGTLVLRCSVADRAGS